MTASDLKSLSGTGTITIVDATIIDGLGHVFDPGFITIKAGKVIAVGKGQPGDGKAPSADGSEGLKISLPGYLITPGLIDSHSHVAMGFFRGLGHGKESMIETFLFPAEKKLSMELLEPLSYSHIIGGIKSGVTCFFDHYYFSEGVGKAFDRLGVRGVVGETVADIGGAFPTADTWTRAKDLIKRWPFSSRVRPVVAPHAADTVSPALMKELAAFAKKEDLPIHMHLSQTAGERRRVMRQSDRSPVAVADKAGLIGESSLLVHMTSASDDDLKLVAKRGATIALCPASQVIYEKLAPLAAFVKHNIRLAIGTDCVASNDQSDILSELKLAALFLADRGVGEPFLHPTHLLAMITSTPAQALGYKEIGSLKKGKAADLVFLKKDIASEPSPRPDVNLVYSMSSRHVKHVMIDGRWVLFDGELVHHDEQTLKRDYLAACAEIKRRISQP